MTGVVTLSIELELGWGIHDKSRYDHLSSDGTTEFKALIRLLNHCDHHRIPITFDIVGHLFHKSCSGQHSGPYPDGWWSEDPGTDLERDPLFYAPKFIQKIRNANVDHEICTHTYSHILCDRVSDELLDYELDKVKKLHEKFNITDPVSIVFPRNQANHYEILKKHDIHVVRRAFENYNSDDNNICSEYLQTLNRNHPITSLNISKGVIETFSTPYASLTADSLPIGRLSPHPAFQVIPLPLRQWLHERYIKSTVKRAAGTAGHAHLWTHVYNMSNTIQWPPISAGLEYIAERRDQGDILIRRMCDLPTVIHNR